MKYLAHRIPMYFYSLNNRVVKCIQDYLFGQSLACKHPTSAQKQTHICNVSLQFTCSTSSLIGFAGFLIWIMADLFSTESFFNNFHFVCVSWWGDGRMLDKWNSVFITGQL